MGGGRKEGRKDGRIRGLENQNRRGERHVERIKTINEIRREGRGLHCAVISFSLLHGHLPAICPAERST
jgi:hypothetical protein